MKNKILLFFFAPFLSFGQQQGLALSNSGMVPVYQQSMLRFRPFEAGSVRMLPSSYFLGIHYFRTFKNGPWGLRGDLFTGFERFNISCYNEFIDYNKNPDLAYYFESGARKNQAYVVSLGVERKVKIRKFIDELSIYSGIYVNQSSQLNGSYSTTFSNIPMTIDGQSYTYDTEIRMQNVEKLGVGLDVSLSLRKYLGQHLYLDFTCKSLLRNQFNYDYAVKYAEYSSSGFRVYESQFQQNKIDYGLLCFQLNLGYRW